MFPDQSVREAFPLPEISRLKSDQDPRRVRALAVHVLADAEARGHTLLPVDQVLQGIRELELDPPCRPSTDLLPLLDPVMEPEVVDASLSDGTRAWQFGQRRRIDDLLRQQVSRRRSGRRHEESHAWRELVDRSLGDMPEDPDEAMVEELARIEKAVALQELFSARFSLLLGPAGTGKTRLLQMLCDLREVRGDGILLLAPTGKARVQMQKNIEGLSALTIAQFLLPERFDPETQQYRLSNAPKVESAGTVIIDESSMVTEDMLAAVFDALRGPKRIILVGDHRQLPPIGAGRPLVDLARELRPWQDDREPPFPRVGPSYAELTVHRRQTGKGTGMAGRDDLLLAWWFTDEAPDPGADEIWARMALDKTDGHVEVRHWQTDEELKDALLETLVRHVPEMEHYEDERGFEISLGGVGTDNGVFFNSTWAERKRIGSAARCESWQLLTPVRGKGHGVEELNRFLHERFRKRALGFADGRRPRTPRPNGAERIIYGDKVISTANNRRSILGRRNELVSNGEIGTVVGRTEFGKAHYNTPERLDVEFSTQPGNTFIYWPSDFGEDRTVVLELAYALTVHKSQGSQFDQVFVVIPQPCFILGRELLYTALTRQVDRVVLLVQGQTSDLRAYTSSKHSEVARRYTNLFAAPDMIADPSGAFLERGLIHRTARGELVRSISEVVVADALHAEGIDYRYEKAVRGADESERYPDFTAEDPATGLTVYWEHLGMLSDPRYAARWEEKLKWYKCKMDLAPNGPENDKGERLVTSENRLDGAIDSAKIRQQVRDVFEL